MSFTIGLDFGTHQTKICVENAQNPQQKIYEFLQFGNAQGDSTLLLPSLVQINDDDTLSYGFIDDRKCKTSINQELEYPTLIIEPRKPTLQLPPKPVKKRNAKIQKGLSLGDQLKIVVGGELTNGGCSGDYQKEYKEWEIRCKKVISKFEDDLKIWKEEVESIKENNNDLISNWEKQKNQKCQFRYFKLATYSPESLRWSYSIGPDVISVWFLTYCLFNIEDRYNECTFQLGVPSGLEKKEFSKQKNKAESIFIAAYNLKAKFKKKEQFLLASYKELLERTLIDYEISEYDKNNYPVIVIPEAYAGLSSITRQGKIETGMSILIDIGGGTTDIAFFTISKDKLPNIHAVISFPEGLNSIFESYVEKNKVTMWDLQQAFYYKKGELENMREHTFRYCSNLKFKVNEMINIAYKNFSKTHTEPRLLLHALTSRPIIFCGGGSVYSKLRPDVYDNLPNSRTILIDKNILDIPLSMYNSIDNNLYTILATSFGLSISLENEIEITDIGKIFDDIPVIENQRSYKGVAYELADD